MIRSLRLPSLALLLGMGIGANAMADGPFAGQTVTVWPSPVVGQTVARPVQAVIPMETVARPRYLGTFRPDPALATYTGPGTTGGYAPAGLPRSYASMSVYGPFSRVQSLPEEVITYSRGYDGVLRPTSTGISYQYPNPARYRDMTLIPTGYKYNFNRGTRTPPGFGRYLMGQE